MLDTIKGSWFFVYEILHVFNNLLFPLDPQRSCVIKKNGGGYYNSTYPPSHIIAMNMEAQKEINLRIITSTQVS